MNQQSGPPFDGTPCPMCPSETAIAYNLANRLRPGGADSLCQVSDKVLDLREALTRVTLTEDSPKELHELHRVCTAIAACDNHRAVFGFLTELSGASAAAQVLTDAHFANKRHSHP